MSDILFFLITHKISNSEFRTPLVVLGLTLGFSFYIIFSEQECLSSKRGTEYMGNLSSAGGHPCVPWNTLGDDYITEEAFMVKKDLNSSQCRLPLSSDQEQPFCWIKDYNFVEHRSCNIPYCGMSMYFLLTLSSSVCWIGSPTQ